SLSPEAKQAAIEAELDNNRTVLLTAAKEKEPAKQVEEIQARATGKDDPANDNRHSRLSAYSGDNEWYTPAKYVEMARTVMGRIDVDPASNDHAQQTVKAATYYTAETNGLNKEWHGTVWMNPPYSHPEIQHFTDKVLAELAAGNVTE